MSTAVPVRSFDAGAPSPWDPLAVGSERQFTQTQGSAVDPIFHHPHSPQPNPVSGANLTTYSWTGYGALESEITGNKATTYAYSGQDQLVLVTPPSGFKSTYTFDGDGLRRTAQEGNVQPTTMVWDGSDYLLLRGPTSDQVVLSLDSEIVHCGGKDLLTDPLGTLVKEITAGATLSAQFQFYPYGSPAGIASLTINPFRFIGAYGYYTDNNDRDYVRARELYKKLGRWMQTDPLWPEESPFLYASGRPVGVTDPSGTIPLACGLICAPGIACAIDVWLVCRNWQEEGFESFLDCAWKVYDELPTWTKWLCWGSLAGCFACLGRELLKRIGPRCPPPCTPLERAALQAAVDFACKSQGRMRCNKSMSCEQLLKNAGLLSACAAARAAINNRCFGGGDPGHKKAEDDARRGATNCLTIYLAKGCL